MNQFTLRFMFAYIVAYITDEDEGSAIFWEWHLRDAHERSPQSKRTSGVACMAKIKNACCGAIKQEWSRE